MPLAARWGKDTAYGEPQVAPASSGADQGAEHKLHDRLLAEAVGNDLRPIPSRPYAIPRTHCRLLVLQVRHNSNKKVSLVYSVSYLANF
jgi:hypothetical protein